jgi:transcriptional regulator with XRE-family HTH domain
MRAVNENPLGTYLKDRRTKLDPAAFGLSAARRRTPGLRREEVAQRANISATWYTWLEQGRGGAPSADVLNRIARALMLTDVEREHLFLLGLGRPPEVRYQTADSVTPRLQRVLDALEFSPAVVSTATWDIVAWNKAAAAVLTDYSALAPEQRNVLRLVFCDPAFAPLSLIGRPSPGSWWGHSGRMRRAPGPRPKSQPSWTNSAGSVPSSRRCGATTTSAATAAASNICGIRSPDRSLSNTRPSRSTAGPISAWWSTIPRLWRMRSGSDRSSSCRPGKLLA